MGARGGLALAFLLLLRFSPDEKIQHLTQNEDSSEHTVLQLQPAPPNNPFSLDCSVFIGLRPTQITIENGSRLIQLVSYENLQEYNSSRDRSEDAIALQMQGDSYSAPRIDLKIECAHRTDLPISWRYVAGRLALLDARRSVAKGLCGP